ncbi:MAG: AraC family transcriptional regulator [Cyclobacteriaceae bacterium]|nr:AraC family transcriptional regulator [Cyclobacteriaceae bacterium]
MHITIYIFLARKKIFQQKKELKQQYSHIDLSWALSLINHISIIFLCAFISGLAQNLSPKSLFHLFILSINIIYIGLILHLLFKALNQPLFEKATRLSPVLDIPQEEVGTIKEKITTLLENQKIFYQPNLTLNEVASAIGYSERVVSYVIKKTLADNFYDLINGYRILDAKRIFKESSDQKLTVLEILYQVGFNSKSSFNTEFKKKTGMTPTEYRKSLK